MSLTQNQEPEPEIPSSLFSGPVRVCFHNLENHKIRLTH